MSDPALWSHQYTSGQSSTDFAFPSDAQWIQIFGSGTVVLAMAGGVTFTRTAVGGEVFPGTYLSLTSTSCTSVVLGNGPIPPAVSPSGTAAGVTVAAISGLTATTAQAAIAEIIASETATKGVIVLRPCDFYLLTGAPLAIFANGASAVPGSALVESEAFGIRWNNNATLDGVVTSYLVPPDADIAADFTLHIRAAKIGATVGDAVTFDVGAWNQVVGSTYIADTNYGGTSSAMTGDAATKTVQNVTRTLALADLAAYPATVTLSIKPTDGTLGTDDLLFLGAFVLYKKKLVS